MPASPKRRDYCFTVNNYTDTDIAELDALSADPHLRYLLIGRETGEEGTPHLQCYVYFNNPVAFSRLKNAVPRAHIEACRGSPQQNITYCKKQGDFHETGTPPMTQAERGKRGREYWDEQLSLAKRGRVDECDSKLQITHHNALYNIQARHAPLPADLDDHDNEWLYGTTGTGKSYTARTENPGAYLKMCNKWWDGYKGEDVAIIEDFDKVHSVLGHHLKIWADRYAFRAEVKGTTANLRPKRIIVTSNWHPSEIWPTEPQTLEPILRRFKVYHFTDLINSPSI